MSKQGSDLGYNLRHIGAVVVFYLLFIQLICFMLVNHSGGFLGVVDGNSAVPRH